MRNQVILANGMRTDAKNIEWHRPTKRKLYAEKYEEAVLDVIGKFSITITNDEKENSL